MSDIKTIGALRNIKTIRPYKTTLELLDDNDADTIGSKLFQDMLRDQGCRDILEAEDSFESYGYLLVNDDTVVMYDTIDGEILDRECLVDFVKHTEEFILDQIALEDQWNKECYVV